MFLQFGMKTAGQFFTIHFFYPDLVFSEFKKGTAPTRSGSAALVQVLQYWLCSKGISSWNTVFVYKTIVRRQAVPKLVYVEILQPHILASLLSSESHYDFSSYSIKQNYLHVVYSLQKIIFNNFLSHFLWTFNPFLGP